MTIRPDGSREESIVNNLTFSYQLKLGPNDDELIYQLFFDNPELVSMGENYDGIHFRLNAEQINKYVMFMSADGKPI